MNMFNFRILTGVVVAGVFACILITLHYIFGVVYPRFTYSISGLIIGSIVGIYFNSTGGDGGKILLTLKYITNKIIRILSVKLRALMY